MYHTPRGSLVEGLKRQGTTSFSTNEIGKVSDGSCSGTEYVYKSRRFDKVVSYDLYEISLGTEDVVFNTDETLNLKNLGLRYSQRSYQNTEGYFCFWTYKPIQKCSGNDLSLLYEGEATNLVQGVKESGSKSLFSKL